MSELLIELFSEEIPARMQLEAVDGYKKIFEDYLGKQKIKYANVTVFCAPRRIAINISDINSTVAAVNQEIRGPKVSAPRAAIEGFCNSHNVQEKDLDIIEIDDVRYFLYKKFTPEQKTSEIIKKDLAKLISSYVWKKSMYWGDYKIKWVRPLKNIMCIFDGQVVDFNYGHLKSNNLSYGHRFLSPDAFEVKSFEQYKVELNKKKVILDQNERKKYIKEQAIKLADDLGLTLNEDEALLNEISGLVEFPRVLLGKIDSKFLSLPSEMLVSSMRSHQKYMSLLDKDGKFAPYFIFVSNIDPDNAESIISGNEKVLSARLEDALYFYNQDLLTSLKEKSSKLGNVIFHAKLGSLKNKVSRISEMIKYLCPGNKEILAAASICKSDIVSEAVNEFPDLQGVMGYYYAIEEGQDKLVAEAIKDHYKPQGISDQCPKGMAAYLSIADKVDTLCGLFLANEKPTSSKDPFALRRQVLGIVRIIIDNKLNIDLYELVRRALLQYKNLFKITEDIKSEILTFIEERIRYFLKSYYNEKLISSILNLKEDPIILNTHTKLNVLDNFINADYGKRLINLYKRANNIIENENQRGIVNANLLIDENETYLYRICLKCENTLNKLLISNKYEEAVEYLTIMEKPLNQFFDNVLVKENDRSIANNRILLLSLVKKMFNFVSDFDILSNIYK